MRIISTQIDGVKVVESSPFTDQRGVFERCFCEDELSCIIAGRRIVQINLSCTHQAGTVRGLHFQHPPYAEMKLIRCLRGRVWDVAVDLRKGSASFLQWHAEELSPENRRMMIIPEGFAHGFQALEPDSELLYLHTQFYAPQSAGGVSCDDQRLAIAWPLPVADLSSRDRNYPAIPADFGGIEP
jgi:dTDP-4-dehydrorhamnose 3,5-epimerase